MLQLDLEDIERSGFGREGGEEGLLDYLTYSDKILNNITDKRKK